MKPAMSRAIKSAQLKMRLIAINVNGTAVAPVASGFDKSQITSVTKNGTGDYTIVLKKPFDATNASNCQVMVQSLTAQRVAHVHAVSATTITVRVTDLGVASTGTDAAAADADLSLWILGQDFRFNH